jgi:hypothetical protein
VNAAPNPVDPPAGPHAVPSISAAADRARAELHAEIERVRIGVEEVLAEHGGPVDVELERELANLREDTRLYVKKRIRRSEKKIGRSVEKVEQSVEKIDERTRRLEARIDQVEADRAAAEVRIHSDTERMLDGLLAEVRAIADLLTEDS